MVKQWLQVMLESFKRVFQRTPYYVIWPGHDLGVFAVLAPKGVGLSTTVEVTHSSDGKYLVKSEVAGYPGQFQFIMEPDLVTCESATFVLNDLEVALKQRTCYLYRMDENRPIRETTINRAVMRVEPGPVGYLFRSRGKQGEPLILSMLKDEQSDDGTTDSSEESTDRGHAGAAVGGKHSVAAKQ